MNERIRELAEQAGFRYIKDEGIGWAGNHNASLPRFAELVRADGREKVAQWMIERGFATGHGDSIEDLLKEIEWQIESRTKQAYCDGLENGLDAELKEKNNA
jgi:hypothetical protein